MKGQPNRDLNPVPPSQETNHATNWANEAGFYIAKTHLSSGFHTVVHTGLYYALCYLYYI